MSIVIRHGDLKPLEGVIERREHESFFMLFVESLVKALFPERKNRRLLTSLDPKADLFDLCKNGLGSAKRSAESREKLYKRIKTIMERNLYLAHDTDDEFDENNPMHLLCANPQIASDLRLIQLIISASECLNEGEEDVIVQCQKLQGTVMYTPTTAPVVRIRNAKGESPLHIACNTVHIDNTKVVEYLLTRHPTGVCIPDYSGNLPLHVVCIAARKSMIPIKIFRQLLEVWSDSIKVANHDGNLPLHLLVVLDSSSNRHIQENQLDIVKYMVKQFPESIEARNSTHKTPLSMAIESIFGSPFTLNHPMIRFLQNKADVLQGLPEEDHYHNDISTLGEEDLSENSGHDELKEMEVHVKNLSFVEKTPAIEKETKAGPSHSFGFFTAPKRKSSSPVKTLSKKNAHMAMRPGPTKQRSGRSLTSGVTEMTADESDMGSQSVRLEL